MKTLKTLQKALTFAMMCSAATAATAQTRPVVQFVATGGTIAMKVDPVTKGVVPAISGDDLMQTVPDAGKYATIGSTIFRQCPPTTLSRNGGHA